MDPPLGGGSTATFLGGRVDISFGTEPLQVVSGVEITFRRR